MPKVSDERVQWHAQYRRDDEVGWMARELLAARRVARAALKVRDCGWLENVPDDVSDGFDESLLAYQDVTQ